ncbi:hypothetical protein OS493_001352 [Desmophyllum pertusum]|uniref:Uncharacterized protein n=1 Tax=Desmophyllum pertusum TaxID=174260 RepID=A0A9X0CZI6_9CNID|nr:hypothetical protein OS493_001352 [Desmophyllum pertusum]
MELDDKYAHQKQFIQSLPVSGHVGLAKDEMAMSLIPEDLPQQPDAVAAKTTDNGDCQYNVVSLALVGEETQVFFVCL